MQWMPCIFHERRSAEACQMVPKADIAFIRRKAHPHEHQRASNALLPVSDKASHLFKTHVLQAMEHDRISLEARQDPLIVTFGTKMFAKSGHHVQQHQYISSRK